MKYDIPIQTWPDGHQLLRDKCQWVVRHIATCPNARRGNLMQDWAKETYFQDERCMEEELRACHLPHSDARVVH